MVSQDEWHIHPTKIFRNGLWSWSQGKYQTSYEKAHFLIFGNQSHRHSLKEGSRYKHSTSSYRTGKGSGYFYHRNIAPVVHPYQDSHSYNVSWSSPSSYKETTMVSVTCSVKLHSRCTAPEGNQPNQFKQFFYRSDSNDQVLYDDVLAKQLTYAFSTGSLQSVGRTQFFTRAAQFRQSFRTNSLIGRIPNSTWFSLTTDSYTSFKPLNRFFIGLKLSQKGYYSYPSSSSSYWIDKFFLIRNGIFGDLPDSGYSKVDFFFFAFRIAT